MMCRSLLVASLLVLSATASHALEVAVIPHPQSIQELSGSFSVDSETTIYVTDARAESVARYFSDLLFQTRGFRPLIAQGDAGDMPKKSMLFAVDNVVGQGIPESYQLEINSKNVKLAANDARGLFYGATTLWQLLTADAARSDSVKVAAMRVLDAPRMKWRGLLLDSARSYQSVAFIKRFIDTMALHKLNVLHWHLADDQAWRLEIKKYPRLTDARSTSAVGFYTQDQIREIVKYAQSRYVTIVPGIEMPGHATAAILAYPQLGTVSPPVIPVDSRNTPGGASNLYNVEDATFTFLDDVLAEVVTLFPGDYVHIGASDVSKDQWKNSAAVQSRMRDLKITNEQKLQRYFIERVAAMLTQRNRRMIGWDGVLSGGIQNNSAVMTAKGLDGALTAAASGYDVVVSSSESLNLDRRQASAEAGRSLTDGLLSLEDIYKFDPAPSALTAEDRNRFIGLQANVWTSMSRSEDELEMMTFPRAAAVAEIAWSPADKIRWSSFLQRIVPQLGRYASLGIRYSDAAFRVMVIPRGTMTADTVRIELAKQTPLGEIRYSVNGSDLTPKSKAYADVFDVSMPVTVKATAYHNGVALTSPMIIQLDRDTVARMSSGKETSKTATEGP